MRNRSVTYLPEVTFHALADPTRRAVLDLLRRGAQPAGQIAKAFPISRPAISKHLRQLRKARRLLVARRRFELARDFAIEEGGEAVVVSRAHVRHVHA